MKETIKKLRASSMAYAELLPDDVDSSNVNEARLATEYHLKNINEFVAQLREKQTIIEFKDKKSKECLKMPF